MPQTANQGYRFLVAQDDHTASRGLVRWAMRYGECVHATSYESATAALSEVNSLTALIVDEQMHDGSGMQLAENARKLSISLPILVISADASRATVARAFRMDATVLRSPISPRDVDLFLNRATVRVARRDESRSSRLQVFSRMFALSPRQEELLTLLSTGMPRRSLAAHVGMSENTVKTQVRAILKKTHAHSLEHALYRALIDGYEADRA